MQPEPQAQTEQMGPMVRQVQPERRVHREYRERQGRQAQMARMEQPERRAHRDRREFREPQAHLDRTVRTVQMGRQFTTEQGHLIPDSEPMATSISEHQHLRFTVQKSGPIGVHPHHSSGPPAHRGLKVRQAHRVRQEVMVQTGQMERPDLKGFKVFKALPEPTDLMVQMEPMGRPS